jgi:hypothetical protein
MMCLVLGYFFLLSLISAQDELQVKQSGWQSDMLASTQLQQPDLAVNWL